MTVRWRGRHVFDVLEARQIVGFGMEHRGDVHYVDSTNGSNSNAGSSWATAFASLTFALTKAGDWDIIGMAGGDYTEEVVITQRGLKIVGEQGHGLNRGPVLFIGEGTGHLMTIRNHDVELANLGFYQVAAYGGVVISELPETWWRAFIHDCGFSSSGTGTYGVYAGAVAAEAPYTVVERCRFYNIATAGVRLNSGSMVVKDSIFQVKASAIGVEDVPNSASRPDRWILHNKFKTIDVTNAIGVKVTNTPSAGQLMIDENRFVGFADNDHCISKRTGYTGLNYAGVTAIPIT